MDTIADMLNRIKNAQKVGHAGLDLPFSKINFEIAKILAQEGFLSSAVKKGAKAKERLELVLKYEMGVPAIQDLKRVSKLGQRCFIKADKIKVTKQSRKLTIISTSRGLMTGGEARKKKLGGEVICEIW